MPLKWASHKRCGGAFRLSSAIHFLVIFLVFSRSYIVKPFLVVKIPADCLFNALLELKRRFPAKFPAEFGGVDCVAQVVPGPVGYISNQMVRSPFRIAQQFVCDLYQNLYQVNVLPFVESADVLSLCDFSVMENDVNRSRVVFHEQPVAHIFPLSI